MSPYIHDHIRGFLTEFNQQVQRIRKFTTEGAEQFLLCCKYLKSDLIELPKLGLIEKKAPSAT